MTLLVIGLILFLGVHLFSYLRSARAALTARLGEGPYKGIYALISAVGLGLVIWGYSQTRAGPAAADILYWPPSWARHATMFLVLLAMICFAVYFHRGW
ncbi:MAG TPA: NnrU family protein, partial [Aestuariivirgaceae bacterium]|nr:NnrU family protein [Aestuariivirgaceae bacterium]